MASWWNWVRYLNGLKRLVAKWSGIWMPFEYQMLSVNQTNAQIKLTKMWKMKNDKEYPGKGERQTQHENGREMRGCSNKWTLSYFLIYWSGIWMVGLVHRTKHISRPFEYRNIWNSNSKKVDIKIFPAFKWSVFRSSLYFEGEFAHAYLLDVKYFRCQIECTLSSWRWATWLDGQIVGPASGCAMFQGLKPEN